MHKEWKVLRSDANTARWL